ncbi:NlpC/P60 family protein [Williamsia sp. CHRR-6]|uniref:C40 family peptidase n=1 Tax=Williamsia sp. CHRR-6 TaxID=2835871 RepID=UPI001BD9F940|nr:C40 family peptidase [Williamsia sp. CHRR-6]MBT0565295.1 C40 family peptidase [Williamsia sp. CHRR-6]
MLVSTFAFVAAAPPVSAAPQNGPDALLARYQELGREAEKSAEAMHNAEIELGKRKADQSKAAADAAAATATLNGLRTRLDDLQGRVDTLVRAGYRGAKVNRLYAVLVADSPQALLDQMSGLEQISRQTTSDLRSYRKASASALRARTAAEKAGAVASAAVAAVNKTRSELQTKQTDLQFRIAQVKAIYESLTGAQLRTLRGPTITFDAALVPKGTSASAVAVTAALSRIGDPYVWGATGPSQFDCSGLMVWAYKQAGKTLPRSSEAQQASGTPVDRKDLQPGDLIIYYGDASHVGMYVGDGYVVHASTFGVPVKVVPIDAAGPYQSARRY